jgi:hypothetical protein
MFVRPNWRDPEPYKELLDPDLWNCVAWEFLRRNPEYQRDYEVYHADFGNKQIDDDPDGFDYWCAFAEHKWRINRPIAPYGDEFDGNDFIDLPFDQIESFKQIGFNNIIEGPLVLIPVDLSKPLKELEAQLKQQVKWLREEGIKQGTVAPRVNRVLAPRIYVQHLRILDAFAAGATVQEIGDVLAPGAANEPDSRQRDKRINAAHKAALKMQDGGYRVLI